MLFRFALDFSRHFCWRRLTGPPQLRPPGLPPLSTGLHKGAILGFDQQILIVMTSLLASIGAAAVPSAGLVVIFIVLEAVNLTGPQVALIVGAMLAINRPLDMYRTVVNVVSDSCGAAIIARSEGEKDVDTVVRPADPRPDNSRSQPGSAGHRPRPS